MGNIPSIMVKRQKKKSIRKKIRDTKISLQIETLYFNV